MCFLANIFGDCFVVLVLISSYNIITCDAISNMSFNSSLRDYYVNDTLNSTYVKTLQKEESGKKLYILPASNPIKFKETQDGELSGTSNSRGLLIHDYSGYKLNDYEEGPHYEYGHEYQPYDPHHNLHGSHGYEHYSYDPYYNVRHYNYEKGHYAKYYKHALATKAALWPLAGLALLGAAAALVTNPVLLQLGVVSGKRRRRDTEEITGYDFTANLYKNNTEKLKSLNNEVKIKTGNLDIVKSFFKSNDVRIENSLKNKFKNIDSIKLNNVSIKRNRKKRLIIGTEPSVHKTTYVYSSNRYDIYDNNKFIPVPIMLRTPKPSRT